VGKDLENSVTIIYCKAFFQNLPRGKKRNNRPDTHYVGQDSNWLRSNVKLVQQQRSPAVFISDIYWLQGWVYRKAGPDFIQKKKLPLALT
jgi:hypothetical protein